MSKCQCPSSCPARQHVFMSPCRGECGCEHCGKSIEFHLEEARKSLKEASRKTKWQKFCELWHCVLGAQRGWPGLTNYCDECGGNPCSTWIECQRIREARCEVCGDSQDECETFTRCRSRHD